MSFFRLDAIPCTKRLFLDEWILMVVVNETNIQWIFSVSSEYFGGSLYYRSLFVVTTVGALHKTTSNRRMWNLVHELIERNSGSERILLRNAC